MIWLRTYIKKYLIHHNEGFALASLLVGVSVMSIVLLCVLWMSTYFMVWHRALQHTISVTIDGIYTRRVVMKNSQWAHSSPSVENRGRAIRFSHAERFNWTVNYGGVYRIMQNGTLQPTSGTGVQHVPSSHSVHDIGVDPFGKDDMGLITLQWRVQKNRLHAPWIAWSLQDSSYDVHISFWPLYEWVYRYET